MERLIALLIPKWYNSGIKDNKWIYGISYPRYAPDKNGINEEPHFVEIR